MKNTTKQIECTVGNKYTDSEDWSNDEIQDVFGSDSSSSPILEGFGNSECSDILRLEKKHHTEGYREGISQGKVKVVQRAFDEGFGLGAVIGSRVGLMLGLLEGLARARIMGTSEVMRMQKLLVLAEKELSAPSVFGTEWWEEQGVWKYEITGIDAENEATFHHVAKAHPLLKKWEIIVEEEMHKRHLDKKIFEIIGDEYDNKPESRNLKIEDKRFISAKIITEARGDDLELSRKDLHW